ncbi:hypothetical protein QJS10_CPA03g01560 [Acorus calamus]|uniref:Uncharacterized protein n=1 Tax=Acorus calamus TaxID=4465 RepID=A0AAV9F724_ACOCL|nr:hypothetical protein QJS10_CPA03g01560 [Acorus calamus]
MGSPSRSMMWMPLEFRSHCHSFAVIDHRVYVCDIHTCHVSHFDVVQVVPTSHGEAFKKNNCDKNKFQSTNMFHRQAFVGKFIYNGQWVMPRPRTGAHRTFD